MVGWRRFRDVLAGAAVLLALECMMVYGIGVRVDVPKGQILALSKTVTRELDRRWPQIQAPLMSSMRPLVKAQVHHIVSTVTINIGGVPITLPPDLQKPVARELTTVVDVNLTQYFRHQFRPGQLLTPALVAGLLKEPVRIRVWVDLWRIPVPVFLQVP